LKSDFDRWNLLGPRKFKRVRDQVIENLSNHIPIAERRRQFMNLESDFALFVRGLNFFEYAVGKLFHVDVSLVQMLPPQMRKRQKAVDEFAHAAGIAANNVQQTLAFNVQFVGIL